MLQEELEYLALGTYIKQYVQYNMYPFIKKFPMHVLELSTVY